MIKKFSNWFIRQTFTAKISLVALIILIVVGGIIQLASLTTPKVNRNIPVPTTPPTSISSPQPSGTANPNIGHDKIIDIGNTNLNDGTVFKLPYTIDQMFALNTFTRKAAIEQCKATAGENNASIIARITPYFQNPAELVKQNYFYTDSLNQGCTILSTDPVTFNETKKIITYSVTAIKYFVAPDQASLPVDKRLVQRANATFIYECVLQPNGSWIITGLAAS